MKRAPRLPGPALRRAALGALTLALVAAAACEGAGSYVFTAQRFDASAACLEPYRAVEVVEGPGVAATCPASCLTVGAEVFVTTMCPPLPTIATELAEGDEACVAARAALGTTCGEEPATATDGSAPDGSAPSDLDANAEDAGDGA
ncbi:MAG: hypothetical protein KF764_32600 [Labilithrix sp.]|nr:hypothetical protein [Labilithrix sp.]